MPGQYPNPPYEMADEIIRRQSAQAYDALGRLANAGYDQGFDPAIGFIAELPAVSFRDADMRDFAEDIAQGLQLFRDNDPRFDLAIDGEELVQALSHDLALAMREAAMKAVNEVASKSVARYGRRPQVQEGPSYPRFAR